MASSSSGGGTHSGTGTRHGRFSYPLPEGAVAGDLDITKTNGTVYLVGNGTAATIIDGAALDRVFDVRPGAAAYFEDLTITNGKVATSNHGGGFRNQGGIAVLQGVDLVDNDASYNNDSVGGG